MYKTINSRCVRKAYYLHNLGVCGAHDLDDAIQLFEILICCYSNVFWSNIRSGVCRYMAAKKYAESIDLLQSGAVMQLKHGQVTTSITHDVHCYQTMQCTEEFSHDKKYLGEKLLDQYEFRCGTMEDAGPKQCGTLLILFFDKKMWGYR